MFYAHVLCEGNESIPYGDTEIETLRLRLIMADVSSLIWVSNGQIAKIVQEGEPRIELVRLPEGDDLATSENVSETGVENEIIFLAENEEFQEVRGAFPNDIEICHVQYSTAMLPVMHSDFADIHIDSYGCTSGNPSTFSVSGV